MIEVLPTDKLFTDSPDAGRPDCICSRCGNKITEDEVPLRCWPENEKGVDGKEYRFCENCFSTMGVISIGDQHFDNDTVFDERSCRICGCTEDNACYNEKQGACWWVEEDQCSHCDTIKNFHKEQNAGRGSTK